MRDGFAGDEHDFHKFAILRRLAPAAGSVGIAWYYNPGDKRPGEGGHGGYRAYQTAGDGSPWSVLDAGLVRALHNRLPRRSFREGVRRLEAASLVPGAAYFREPLPAGAATSVDRVFWSKRLSRWAARLPSPSLVFLDPDNGLANGAATSRHAIWAEVDAILPAGHHVMVFQHLGRARMKDREATFRRAFRIMGSQWHKPIGVGRNLHFLLATNPKASTATRVAEAWESTRRAYASWTL